MRRIFKWVGALVVGLALLLAAVLFALQRWVGSDDFRARVQAQAAAALGVPLKLGAIEVDAWPLPAVALSGLELATQPPLTVERVEARPEWAPLLQGRLVVATLVVRKAVVPQQAVAAVAGSMQNRKTAPGAIPSPPPSSPGSARMDWLPRRALLQDVSWVDSSGRQTAVDAQVQLGEDGWPDAASVKVLRGRMEGAQAELKREAGHWSLRAAVGGGTVTGKLQLKPAVAGGSWQVQGQFDTAGVEVSALTAPSRTLTGRVDAQTTLNAQAREPAGLADALHSETRFTVRDAVVHGLDLVKAVQSVGQNRGGETRLDTLAGQVVTQGRAAQLNNLVASSGLLSASGNVTVAADRSLAGRVSVQPSAGGALSGVLGGAVAIPLVVSGTLDAPSVTLSRAALAGAAIGTLVMPGAGTGAGAKLGDKLGSGLRGLFGK